MSIVLGFGSTETAFQEAEFEAFRDFCLSEYRRLDCDYVTDYLAKNCKMWLTARAEEFDAKRDRFKTATDYPPRYSTYCPTVLHDASHIVAIFRFSHINRRHALSPDGWAMMNTEIPVVAFDTSDVRSTR